MENFLEWYKKLKLNEVSLRIVKGWINIRTNQNFEWTDMSEFHSMYMIKNIDKFKNINYTDLWGLLGDETIESLARGEVDRYLVPEYMTFTHNKGWFGYTIGKNDGAVYAENLRQAQAVLKSLEKKGYSYASNFSGMRREHDGFRISIVNNKSFKVYTIKDSQMWNHFVKTGKILDTSRRSEIGTTMAMFRGESVVKENRALDNNEFQAHWKKAPSSYDYKLSTIEGQRDFWKAYFKHFEDKYGTLPERIKKAMRESGFKSNPVVTWKGERFPLRTGMDERDLLYHVYSTMMNESIEISQLNESKYGHTLWVDPKGKVHDMGRSEGNTHYQWVFDNFTKYFGNKQPEQGSDDVYDVPMQKGWARVRNHGMDISVEVDLRKLNRSQKKALRNIVDAGPEYGKELNRPMYIDAWKKNKTSRAGDIHLDNYEDIVDFLSENVQLDESNTKATKAWIKGNKMISWIPNSLGNPYHLQAVVKSPKKYGLDRERIEKILKQQKWLEYPVYYDELVDGEQDRHEGLYTEMFANDWVMVVVQDYGRATIGSLHGKNAALVHAAAKKMMDDKSFQKVILGAEALEMEIVADSSGGLYGSGNSSQRMNGVAAWMSYVESGRVDTRRRSGVAMFRDWVELDESFERPYPVKLASSEDDRFFGYHASVKAGNLQIEIYNDRSNDPNSMWEIDFAVNGHYGSMTEAGDALKVLATVMEAIKMFIVKHEQDKGEKPRFLKISTNKNPTDKGTYETNKRHKVYMRMVERFAGRLGYVVNAVKDNVAQGQMVIVLKDKGA